MDNLVALSFYEPQVKVGMECVCITLPAPGVERSFLRNFVSLQACEIFDLFQGYSATYLLRIMAALHQISQVRVHSAFRLPFSGSVYMVLLYE